MDREPLIRDARGQSGTGLVPNAGFDQELERECDWLVFASTQCPLCVWLGAFGEHGVPMAAPRPKGAVAGRTVSDVPALHRLLRRAFQLSTALPNELLHTFEKQAAARPKTTEAERLVVQRVGQNLFREALLDLWEGHCAATGRAVRALLRASHVTPWADCDTDAERLDVYNGILLAPHLDAVFDRGFITIADDETIVVSDALDGAVRSTLGLDKPPRVHGLADSHRGCLPWHRDRVFDNGCE